MGYRRYKLGEPKGPLPCASVKTRRVEPVLENEHLKAKVNPDGTIDVTLKALRKTFKGLNYFEDGGDAGDEYNFGKPARDKVFSTKKGKARIIQKETTEFYEKLLVGITLKAPEMLAENRRERSKKLTSLEILTEYKLVKGSARVDVTTIVQNNASDHRLRGGVSIGEERG